MNDNEMSEKLRETLNRLYDLKKEKLNYLEAKKQELEEKILEVKRADIVTCLCAAPCIIYSAERAAACIMRQKSDNLVLDLIKLLIVLGIDGFGIVWGQYKRKKRDVCDAEYQTELNNYLDYFDEIDNLLKLLPEEGQQSMRALSEKIDNTAYQNYSRQTVGRTRKRTITEEENIILQNEKSFTK